VEEEKEAANGANILKGDAVVVIWPDLSLFQSTLRRRKRQVTMMMMLFKG